MGLIDFLFQGCYELSCPSALLHNPVSVISRALTFSTVIVCYCFLLFNEDSHSLCSSEIILDSMFTPLLPLTDICTMETQLLSDIVLNEIIEE